MSDEDDRYEPLDDDRVAAVVSAAFDDIGAAPAAAVDAAIAAFAFRDLDALLAELTTDSWDGERSLALRAEPSDVRFLGFRRDGWSLDVELHPDGSVVGQLLASGDDAADGVAVAAAPITELHVESRDGEVMTLALDARGRFQERLTARVVRLRCPGRLVTPWLAW